MCLFGGMIRRFSTARNTKLNSRITHKEVPASQPTKAPLPAGFDATKLDTFARKRSQPSPYNQLNACLNDLSPSQSTKALLSTDVAATAPDTLALKRANTDIPPVKPPMVSQDGLSIRRAVTFEPMVKEHCPVNGTNPERAHNPSYHSDHYTTTQNYR